MVPLTPSKFVNYLRDGKLILLGVSTDPGNESYAGCLQSWSMDSLFVVVKTQLQKDLDIYTVPCSSGRNYVFVGLKGCEKFSQSVFLVENIL